MDTKRNWMRIGVVVGLFTAGCAAQAEDPPPQGVTGAPSETATARPVGAHAITARRHARQSPRSLLRVWEKRTHPEARITPDQEARP